MKLRRSLYVKNFDWTIILIITSIVFISLLMLANASFNPFSEGQAGGFVSVMIHEQYFYPDYPRYQKDFAEKISAAFEFLVKNGFRSVFFEDII